MRVGHSPLSLPRDARTDAEAPERNAQERTRTSTLFPGLPPQGSASASSATWARAGYECVPSGRENRRDGVRCRERWGDLKGCNLRRAILGVGRARKGLEGPKSGGARAYCLRTWACLDVWDAWRGVGRVWPARVVGAFTGLGGRRGRIVGGCGASCLGLDSLGFVNQGSDGCHEHDGSGWHDAGVGSRER